MSPSASAPGGAGDPEPPGPVALHQRRPRRDAGIGLPEMVLPGVGLLVANGILPTVALLGEARHRPWAAFAHVAVGGALVGWIALQLVVIDYVAPAFPVGYLALGVVIRAVALPVLMARRG